MIEFPFNRRASI